MAIRTSKASEQRFHHSLERPRELEGKQSFTPEEMASYEAKVFQRSSRKRPQPAGQVGTYNDFWWDADSKRAPNFHTSLIVDPPDGRVPRLTQRRSGEWMPIAPMPGSIRPTVRKTGR
jgi:hypothetical protein